MSFQLRCAARLGTNPRIDEQVADEASRRLGILAILTATTVIIKSLAERLLEPEVLTVPYRLGALYLLLASVGLFALQRYRAAYPQMLLDLGLAFEVTGAFAIGVMQNPARGSASIAGWIAICTLTIPNKPLKSTLAAFAAAAMGPLAHLVNGHAVHVAHVLDATVIACWTPFLSGRLYRMQKELSRNTELDSYRLEELLGKGGMGEVWRASHRLLRRSAAIKLVRPDLLARANATELRHIQQRFEQEAQAIARLQSPHTVELYDFGNSDDGSLYYAMELLDGVDLETLVERHGPLPAGRVVSILMQACESLEEAHRRGLIHRDIKPTNLFLCRLGMQADFVKVLDFGLVKAILAPEETHLTMVGETTGTPAFMSPEQVRGEGLDARTDIYALGCVAYFLLTGSLVFLERTPMAEALAHVEKTPIPPSVRSELPIPQSLEGVVLACLEKDRERRPRSACDLASRLEGCTDVPPWTRSNAREWWALHQPMAIGAPA